ncbi:MAG: nucleotidyltransferase domain-containing protein [Acidobacteriia bacterium]|nr:nucleotidyltransferase domain-containing protein [Terriglobia bacterium]MYG00939.1 nucleotidyltransferase domain-containing protein [Terriglobia bacterium]MYK12257.1 nucleotidyltransferase domain-containing protein [Terriglobia bacterium]
MRRQFRAGPDERERMWRTLVTVLKGEPDLEFAWLHGSSLAADEFRDIDIGVHLSATAEVRSRRGLELAVRLDQQIGLPLDVGVLNDAPVTFLFHVFREGRLLLSRNDERLADLTERTVREYLDAAPLLRRANIEAYGA